MTGDSDAIVLAKRNANWAHIIDVDHPFDKLPNTWLIRHGDMAWKNFLDSWANAMTVNAQYSACSISIWLN